MTNPADLTVLSRRSMLAALSVGAVGAAAEAAPRLALPAAAASPAGRDLAHAGIADWSALVGERFRLAGAAGAPLRLVKVEPLVAAGARTGASRRRGFAVTFEAPAGRAPEGNSTSWIARGNDAPLPVLLGSPATDGGRTRLVAIFN
ncbi:MAG TPA: hypothetical protein VGB08_05390 [Allosphingosinicella sp.]